MFKFSGIFDLKPGVDREEAWQHWREKHVLYAKEYLLPGPRKYNINRVVHNFENVDVWGISEFWFDDVETALTAIARLQKAPPDDFYIQRIKPARRVILKEDVIDLGGPAGTGHHKLVMIFSLKPNTDPDGAYRVWRDKHTAWVKGHLPPGTAGFTINRVVHKYGEVDVYGYSMIWLRDQETAVKLGDRIRQAPPDEFLATCVAAPKVVVVEEEKVDL